MHCTDDKSNGIVLNHNSDWSGEVRVAWYIASERRDPGPTPPSLRECWVDGSALTAGHFVPTRSEPEPPVNVITRAVALAVEGFLRSKMERALDELFIRRGKL